MTAAAAPAGALEIHRDLHDAASYHLVAAPAGVTTLTIRDADGDSAVIGLDRLKARQLVDDLTLVAGLRPTPATVGRAAALAGSLRIVFEQLRELDKTEPEEVDRLIATIAAQLRSWRPMVLTGVAL